MKELPTDPTMGRRAREIRRGLNASQPIFDPTDPRVGSAPEVAPGHVEPRRRRRRKADGKPRRAA
jgi:hypothetical protein